MRFLYGLRPRQVAILGQVEHYVNVTKSSAPRSGNAGIQRLGWVMEFKQTRMDDLNLVQRSNSTKCKFDTKAT
jgi:hypothetical protein